MHGLLSYFYPISYVTFDVKRNLYKNACFLKVHSLMIIMTGVWNVVGQITILLDVYHVLRQRMVQFWLKSVKIRKINVR